MGHSLIKWHGDPSGPFWQREDGVWAHVPNYSTSIAAAYEMESVIIERELGHKYAGALDAVIARTSRLGMARRWDLIHATAEQRCRAALLAVGQSQRTSATGDRDAEPPQSGVSP